MYVKGLYFESEILGVLLCGLGAFYIKGFTRQKNRPILSAISTNKPKAALLDCFSSLSGKRESVHLLSTLYIKQLPLPSTILPIRGTLGLFQGVVFESDFCHTNFRTTVAYDKFTNNF